MIPESDLVLHLNLDDAWDARALTCATANLREWGPRLRFSAPRREMEEFDRQAGPGLPPFLIFGSGDFHHLTALWLRRLSRLTTVVSFDNHPDWDIRPPYWSCGGWVNRALELGQVEKVSIWGCGNFECWWPARIFGNRRAERAGRLEVHPWADDRSAKEKTRPGAILRVDWREKFARFAEGLAGRQIYVTIDLDCLRAEDAMTNWESGRFHLDDIAWALKLLARSAVVMGGDLCGAWSPARYARRKQRWAAQIDHPKLALPQPTEIARRNLAALGRLLPILTQRDEKDAETDEGRANR